jgi:hypothetical protein
MVTQFCVIVFLSIISAQSVGAVDMPAEIKQRHREELALVNQQYNSNIKKMSDQYTNALTDYFTKGGAYPTGYLSKFSEMDLQRRRDIQTVENRQVKERVRAFSQQVKEIVYALTGKRLLDRSQIADRAPSGDSAGSKLGASEAGPSGGTIRGGSLSGPSAAQQRSGSTRPGVALDGSKIKRELDFTTKKLGPAADQPQVVDPLNAPLPLNEPAQDQTQ